MTPERWKRVEELYYGALARAPGDRAAFLTDACLEDEPLRGEVESLLKETDAEGFLDGPAVLPVPTISDPEIPPMSGRFLGGYLLGTLLGAGGMGEVYRARDTRLERDVAVKILPPAFTSDRDRLARFEREARMLAALNHPNVCAIYGLEEADGIRFLVLELVEGETLERMLGDAAGLRPEAAGLPLRDAMTIARQIADALEIAHERGIVHRDLKPANIKITPDGVVKVLDFGLAKLVVEGSTPDLTLAPVITEGGRRAGAVLGTAAYMSPEQARGLPVDKRTDIWAFGCVLYEMLSGRVAFAGETTSDVIARILEREPDWSALPADTPAPTRRLLLRCLAKDPRKRLRDISDVRLEIDASGEVLPGSFDLPVSAVRSRSLASTWVTWAALAALVTAVGLWEVRRNVTAPVAAPGNPLADAQFTRLTDWEGTEGGAEISPDGRFVVFLADRNRPFDLWRSQVGTGEFMNLTSGMPPRGQPGNILRIFGFSHDGSEIWLSPMGDAGGAKMLLPVTGGTPRPFLAAGGTAPSWSADGERLAYMTISRDGDSLSVADRTGTDAREIIAAQATLHNHNPVWSPDGEWVYFIRGLDPTDTTEVWRIRPAGGSLEQMTQQNALVSVLAPLDSRTLLYVARDQDWSGPWLWTLDVESRVSRRASVGIEQYTSVSASRDGRRVVATVANPVARLWRVPLRDAVVDERDAEMYPVPEPRSLAPRFGGTSLFYLSTSGVGDGLWRARDGQSVSVRKGADGALVEPPAVSRDGGAVAVVLRRDGRRHLVIMSADGTESRTLAASITIRGTIDFSPDGRWIVAGGRDEQGEGLFKVPVDGGVPSRLISGPAFDPVWSPEGDLIVYTALEGGQVPLLAVRPDGTRVEAPPLRMRPGAYRFLPDGSGLVYLPHRQSQDFWLLDLATMVRRQLTRLGNLGRLETFDVSPDGRYIVFDRSIENSDIVLIDLQN
jgi:Tol biopolymer transport system component